MLRAIKSWRSVRKEVLLKLWVGCCPWVYISWGSHDSSIFSSQCWIDRIVRRVLLLSPLAAVCEGGRVKKPKRDLLAIASASLAYFCLSYSVLLIVIRLIEFRYHSIWSLSLFTHKLRIKGNPCFDFEHWSCFISRINGMKFDLAGYWASSSTICLSIGISRVKRSILTCDWMLESNFILVVKRVTLLLMGTL